MVGRAALDIPGRGYNQLYFFKGSKYAKINWNSRHDEQSLAAVPTQFANDWHSLKEAGFTQIDAILPIPGTDHRAYFFSGSQYARIGFVPGTAGEDQIYGGVRPIAENWKSLAKAGFGHLDAALLVPNSQNQAYFFSGEKYCRVSFQEGSQEDDELLDGPKSISEGWPAIPFHSIDAIFPEPRTHINFYVFSGTKYAKIVIGEGGKQELITGPTDVAPDWPALHEAGIC
ncbi:hemopexin domain protein [Ceratobasidium sp. AG-Ba]|nr:hemopexin domain protein [Ceratobasidium sp. AG-Ba]